MSDSGPSTHSSEPCPICGGHAGQRREVDRAGDVAVCRSCGSWYRVPRPHGEDLARIYDEEYYNAWSLNEDEAIARETKRATFANLLGELRPMAESRGEGKPRLLDVGAATGLLLEFAEQDGWDPHAVELNPYSAGVLRRQLGADRVFEGELTACSFPAGHFHAVTMTDLIEHVLDVRGTLEAAVRLLRPNGVLCITTPRVDSLSRRLMGARWLHFKEEHLQYFTHVAIEQALRSVGFTDVRGRRHVKYLALDYLHSQLQTYPHWLLTPVVALLHRLLPKRLRRRPLPYECGEMLITARTPRPLE